MDPVRTSDLDGSVAATVIDDDDLDGGDPRDLGRDACEDGGKCQLLVQTGDLDNELHAMIIAS